MTAEEPAVPSSSGQPCCEEFAQRISDMHDGRWPAGSGECVTVEEHLATCPRCAELLEDYGLISRAAQALRAAEVSEDCAEIMRRRVRATIRGRVFRRRLAWTGAGLAVAAAASVAVAVVMLPDASRTDGPPDLAAAEEAGGTPVRVDLLGDPAVAALLRELEAEALRDRDARPGGALTIQEEIDLRRNWGIRWVRDLQGQPWVDSRVPDVEFPMAGNDWDAFPFWHLPGRRPSDGPDVVPVGDGR